VGDDEEMKTISDQENKLEQMNENRDQVNFDANGDEDIHDIDNNDEKNEKTAADHFHVGKLLKNDAVSKKMKSSSNTDSEKKDGKRTADHLPDVDNLVKGDTSSKKMKSSLNGDDDLDDPNKERIQPITVNRITFCSRF
ncbi:unnamed protein product, partial [Rotaria sp. Silwood2]